MTALGRRTYGGTPRPPMHARNTGVKPVPGDAILQPLALMSLALLVVNDHLFKALWPGPISGKLSDFAGLVYFPLFLTGLWEVAISRSRAGWRPGSRSLFAAVVVTGLVFAGIKTLPSVADAYATAIGTLQSFVGLLAAALTGRPAPAPVHVARAMDTSDLVALPALVVSWLIGLHRASDRRTSAELAAGTRLDDNAITRTCKGNTLQAGATVKRKFLAVDDYGMGGIWVYVEARSPKEITDRYPELKVFEKAPRLMTIQQLRQIDAELHFDIDDPPTGYLAALVARRERE